MIHAGNKKYDLEDRLIEFSVTIIKVCETIHKSPAGIYVSGQLVRSGTSPALHYGEAQSAESRQDFIHKIKVLLKELRESKAALKIILKVPLSNTTELIEMAMAECSELIAIFVKSCETAKTNLLLEKQSKKNSMFAPFV